MYLINNILIKHDLPICYKMRLFCMFSSVRHAMKGLKKNNQNNILLNELL